MSLCKYYSHLPDADKYPPKTIDITAHHIHVRVPIRQFNPIQPRVIVDDILASVIKIHSIQITRGWQANRPA